MRAVRTGMLLQLRALSANTTAHYGDPTCGDTAENDHHGPNLRNG